MLIHEILRKIIDLNRSEYDKKTAKPDEGFYDFTKKVYVNNNRPETRTDWHFEFVPYNERTNHREYHEYKMKYGADFVIAGKDPFVPEGLPPNGDGRYVYMNDVVLMKYPLIVYLRKTDAASKSSKRMGADRLKAFEEMAKSAGAGLPDGFADEYAEKTLKPNREI